MCANYIWTYVWVSFMWHPLCSVRAGKGVSWHAMGTQEEYPILHKPDTERTFKSFYCLELFTTNKWICVESESKMWGRERNTKKGWFDCCHHGAHIDAQWLHTHVAISMEERHLKQGKRDRVAVGGEDDLPQFVMESPGDVIFLNGITTLCSRCTGTL